MLNIKAYEAYYKKKNQIYINLVKTESQSIQIKIQAYKCNIETSQTTLAIQKAFTNREYHQIQDKPLICASNTLQILKLASNEIIALILILDDLELYLTGALLVHFDDTIHDGIKKNVIDLMRTMETHCYLIEKTNTSANSTIDASKIFFDASILALKIDNQTSCETATKNAKQAYIDATETYDFGILLIKMLESLQFFIEKFLFVLATTMQEMSKSKESGLNDFKNSLSNPKVSKILNYIHEFLEITRIYKDYIDKLQTSVKNTFDAIKLALSTSILHKLTK